MSLIYSSTHHYKNGNYFIPFLLDVRHAKAKQPAQGHRKKSLVLPSLYLTIPEMDCAGDSSAPSIPPGTASSLEGLKLSSKLGSMQGHVGAIWL